jgi:hypothetical protein
MMFNLPRGTVSPDLSPLKLSSVHSANGFLSGLWIAHFDESKASWPSSFSVTNNYHAADLSALSKLLVTEKLEGHEALDSSK